MWYYLTHSSEDKGVHIFPKSICPKVNVIVFSFEYDKYCEAIKNKEITRVLQKYYSLYFSRKERNLLHWDRRTEGDEWRLSYCLSCSMLPLRPYFYFSCSGSQSEATALVGCSPWQPAHIWPQIETHTTRLRIRLKF